ncbi:MAG: DUF3592 domain-containing protein [Methylococcales bacterium]
MLLLLLKKLKYLFILLCGLVLLAVSPFASKEVWQQYQSQDWPKTLAYVTDVDRVYYPKSGGYLHLIYAYSLDGELHVRELEEKVHKQYQLTEVKPRWDSYVLGKQIEVCYAPAQHDVSFLEHEQVHSLSAVLAIFIFLFVGGGLLLAVAVSGLKEK